MQLELERLNKGFADIVSRINVHTETAGIYEGKTARSYCLCIECSLNRQRLTLIGSRRQELLGVRV